MKSMAMALLVILPACAWAPKAPPEEGAGVPLRLMNASPAEIERGRLLVETRCATCHASGPRDRSGHRDAPPLRSLSERYPVTALEEAFAEGIMVGHPDMPEFQLTPDEINAVLGYIESIQLRRGADAAPHRTVLAHAF